MTHRLPSAASRALARRACEVTLVGTKVHIDPTTDSLLFPGNLIVGNALLMLPAFVVILTLGYLLPGNAGDVVRVWIGFLLGWVAMSGVVINTVRVEVRWFQRTRAVKGTGLKRLAGDQVMPPEKRVPPWWMRPTDLDFVVQLAAAVVVTILWR